MEPQGSVPGSFLSEICFARTECGKGKPAGAAYKPCPRFLFLVGRGKAVVGQAAPAGFFVGAGAREDRSGGAVAVLISGRGRCNGSHGKRRGPAGGAASLPPRVLYKRVSRGEKGGRRTGRHRTGEGRAKRRKGRGRAGKKRCAARGRGNGTDFLSLSVIFLSLAQCRRKIKNLYRKPHKDFSV